jgi:hypothetical protein
MIYVPDSAISFTKGTFEELRVRLAPPPPKLQLTQCQQYTFGPTPKVAH